MVKKELKVFISYVREDKAIADALNNALTSAFGATVSVFLDTVSMQKGEAITNVLRQKLCEADVLAVVSTGRERPSHDWAGFELGSFDTSHQPPGPADRGPLWGRVVVLCSPGANPRPLDGNNYITLDVDAETLRCTRDEYENSVQVHDDDAVLTWFGDMYHSLNGKKIAQNLGVRDQIKENVKDFKKAIFSEYKNRAQKILKPQKQLIINYDRQDVTRPGSRLTDTATVKFFDQTSHVFGVPPPVSSSWKDFCGSINDKPMAKLWIGSLERLLAHTTLSSAVEAEHGMFIPSHDLKKLYRPVVTTCTLYHNNRAEASIYLIEVFRHKDYGDPATSKLLKGLQLVCRFRFLFLEKQSELHQLNIRLCTDMNALRELAARIIGELDLLTSDIQEAALDQPATWTMFIDASKITSMAEVWEPRKKSLQAECTVIIEAEDHRFLDLRRSLAEYIQDLSAAVEPMNTEMLRAMSDKLTHFTANLRPKPSSAIEAAPAIPTATDARPS